MPDTLNYQPGPLNPESIPPTDPAFGVYYRPEDSPGIFIRFMVAVTDALIILPLLVLVCFLFGRLAGPTEALARFLPAAVVGWIYLVGLKVTRLGTLGYYLFGLKLVSIRGTTPPVWRVTLRAVLAIWLNPVIDLFWMASDGRRQALRDRVAGTYMIYRRATPAGAGPISYARLHVAGLHFIHAQVQPGTADAPKP